MMARRIENADGIYPKLAIPLEEVTHEDVTRMGKCLAEYCNLDARLAHMARAIKPLVGDLTPNGDLVDPCCTSERQGLARQLHFMLRDLPEVINAGDIRRAILKGIDIGELAQRIDVLPFEKKVVQVNSTTRKLRESNREKGHDPKQIDKAIRLFNQLMREPNAQKKVAYSTVKNDTGIPGRTLRYHLKKREANR
jgi:hypothetical protein